MTENLILKKIERILSAETGLAPDSIGSKSIESAVKNISAGLNISITELSEYLAGSRSKLDSEAACHSELVSESTRTYILDKLIQELSVPETWFFRDRAAYDYLKKYVIREHLLYPLPFKVLSAPCSSGEEPYSIAITLEEAGMPRDRYIIDAVDINPAALQKAKLGLFRKSSFRPFDEAFIRKYFQEEQDFYKIDERLKKNVKFKRQNIIKPEFHAREELYNVIFCKNLLIYLTEHARKQTIRSLKRLLKPGGILFTGHTEVQNFKSEGFKASGEPRTFALVPLSHSDLDSESHQDDIRKDSESRTLISRKISDTPQTLKKNKYINHEILNQVQNDTSSEILKHARNDKIRKNEKNNQNADRLKEKTLTLHSIKVLADSGSTADAKRLADIYRQQYPSDPEGFYLSGLINIAENNPEDAVKNFNAAVYLNPLHYEALIHLSLIFGKKGDTEKEDLFRQRAVKVYEKNNKK